ncbi:OstA-like protein [Sunxiuqinia elliptica]|uniref:OstA-like protein n=1 Tax=Sunxiuqinia elliptica TaxID=655355 RepID=A0A4V3BXT3_9BACT|nr:OstA-like protein [Sunxiuqinia elliptica]TDN99868.1 OstA-like protein [Sunxiuqinia elliptica]TDO57060.1 OstA-like protein [Sunxiuqinia elliptica]
MSLKSNNIKLVLILLLLPVIGLSQTRKKVNIEQAEFLEFNEHIVKNAQRLIGNVIISHNNVRMWCDSAYSYTDTNMVDAFGHVHILKDDTLHMYSDYLNYNSGTKWARATGNVKLVNKSTTLTSDTLDFDMTRNVGYYNDYGTIIDSTSTLHSKIGEYYVDDNKAYFKTDVEVLSEDYTLDSDTLIYDTKTKIVSIVGPTRIRDEETALYAESGFYNSITGSAELFENPEIIGKEQKVNADSIFYDKPTGDGKAIGNARIEDFRNRMVVKGNRIVYNDLQETAMATDSALFMLYSEKDTLFLHADTLKSVPDTVPDEKLVLAYFQVKFFRDDMQGKCDSMVYWSKDSTIQLYHEPVVWSENNQMTSEYIEMITQANGPDLVRMEQNAFIVAMEDSGRYNQIKGRDMLGYIRNNELYKINVDGNGQSVYYARDSKGLIGLNKAQSSNIEIYLDSSKVKKIVFIKAPDGELLPILDIPEEDKELPGFQWLNAIRPKRMEDIFKKHQETKIAR